MNRRTLLSWSACSALAVSALTLPAVAAAGPESCDNRDNNTHAKLLECVTLDGVRAHQAAFQAIADANGGTRVSGTQGYDASVDYVAQALSEAGYDVVIQPFDYTTFVTLSPTVLEQVTPPPAGPVPNTIMAYSGNGDVTASVSALPAAPGIRRRDANPAISRAFRLAVSR
jgi:aminopeptidase Y